MANTLHLQQTYRQTLDGLSATIRAIVRAVAAEHTLALRAATKAASPRQSLPEVRAMYVPRLDPHQESAFRAAVPRAGTDESTWFTHSEALANYFEKQVRTPESRHERAKP